MLIKEVLIYYHRDKDVEETCPDAIKDWRSFSSSPCFCTIFSIVAFRVSCSSWIAFSCSINALLFLLVSLSASFNSRFLCVNDVDPLIYPCQVPSTQSTISSGCIGFPSKDDWDSIHFISFCMHSINQTSPKVVESNKNLKMSKKYYINLVALDSS